MNTQKILYVDDEPINLRHFKAAFEGTFKVVTALSGDEALAIFREDCNQEIAIVLSDYRMPGMDGAELLAMIYQENPDPIRIILTAYADFEVISHSVNKGHIYQYVQKPWDYKSLKSVLLRASEAFVLIKENQKLMGALAEKNLDLQAANENLELELQKNRISEQKRRKVESLLLSQAKLASLGEMATGIAHEINQPLTYIKIMMEATRHDFRGKLTDVEEFLKDVDESLLQITRITTIINHLRTFGRSDSPQFDAVSVLDVLNDTLIPLRHRLRVDMVEVTILPENDIPLVFAGATQLEQVFINLIGNALDAMAGSSHKKVTVKIGRSVDSVLITIADNGCGMSQGILARIFEPFYTTKEVGHGTGIGLAISYGIINDHGGTITCRSAVGVGTLFSIILPAYSL